MALFASLICFVVCHAGPAAHFVTFVKQLEEANIPVQVYVAGLALQKFEDQSEQEFIAFSLAEEDAAEQIAAACANAKVVITDVGHPFAARLLETLRVHHPDILRLAYYDNPENYVPGGYSQMTAQVLRCADRVLFANANFVELPIYETPQHPVELSPDQRIGIGYYPVADAEKIRKKRAQEHAACKAEWLEKIGWSGKPPRILTYFGGNNTVYFEKAFPAFLTSLAEASAQRDLSDQVILFQQHPGAKKENRDREMLQKWMEGPGQHPHAPRVIVSQQSMEEVLVLSEGALYYQTSMGPLIALSGIPVLQVGHEPFQDLLVRSGICRSADNAEALLEDLKTLAPLSLAQQKELLFGLGSCDDWFERLCSALE